MFGRGPQTENCAYLCPSKFYIWFVWSGPQATLLTCAPPNTTFDSFWSSPQATVLTHALQIQHLIRFGQVHKQLRLLVPLQMLRLVAFGCGQRTFDFILEPLYYCFKYKWVYRCGSGAEQKSSDCSAYLQVQFSNSTFITSKWWKRQPLAALHPFSPGVQTCWYGGFRVRVLGLRV